MPNLIEKGVDIVFERVPEEAIIGGTVGAAMTVLAELVSRLDQALNPNIFDALKANMEWWQVFTSQHAVALTIMQHEPVSTLIFFGFWSALVGTIYHFSK